MMIPKKNILFSTAILIFMCSFSIYALSSSDETPFEWYDTFKGSIPSPKLLVQQKRDATTFTDLSIPAILAILKFELKFGTWPKLNTQTRENLGVILEDKNLEIIFTGKQSKLAHSSGGQTIDRNTILINSEGFFRFGAKKSPHELARIILHEIGHVHYLRYDWVPASLKGESLEYFPNLVESQLSSRYFAEDMVEQMNTYIMESPLENANENSGCGAPKLLWSGEWVTGWTAGVLEEGSKISMTLRLNPISGDIEGNYQWENGEILKGKISGIVLTGEWKQPGNNSEGAFEFTLKPGCHSFSGHWKDTHGKEGVWSGSKQ